MIRYRVCYEIVTEESAAMGDAEERGIEGEYEDDFRTLVEELEFCEPSNIPPDETCWYSKPAIINPQDCSEEILTYHPITPRDGRYMFKAWKVRN